MIKLSNNQIEGLVQSTNRVATEWSDITARLSKVNSGLDIKIAASENIKNSLNQIEKASRKEMDFYTGLSAAIKNTQSDFSSKEKQLSNLIKGAIAFVGAFATKGVSGAVTNIQPNASVPIQSNSPSKVEVPAASEEYALSDVTNRYDRIKGWKNTTNGKFKDQCPRLVTYQLQDKGIYVSKDIPSGCCISAGKGYASAIGSRNVLINGYQATSYANTNALIEQSNKEVMTNVIVSFSGKGDGHVVLIDRIQDGKVYYMDNGDPEGNGTAAVYSRDINEFFASYTNHYNSITAITHLHQ